MTAPDRFVVRSITGYGLGIGSHAEATSYWVLDLDYAQVVARFYSREGEHGSTVVGEDRRRAAEAKARYLNEWHRRWLHSGAREAVAPVGYGIVA